MLTECTSAEQVMELARANARRVHAQRVIPKPQPVKVEIVSDPIENTAIKIRFVPNLGFAHCWVRAFPWPVKQEVIPAHIKNRVALIQKIVCEEMNVSLGDVLSQRRTALPVMARQVGMYLAKKMTPYSLPEIGRRFGGRDHTTVLHAVRRVTGKRADDPSVNELVSALEKKLQVAMGERAW